MYHEWLTAQLPLPAAVEPEVAKADDPVVEASRPSRRLREKTSPDVAMSIGDPFQKREAEFSVEELPHDEEPEDAEMMTLVKALGYDETAWVQCLKILYDATISEMLQEEERAGESAGKDSPEAEEKSWLRMENGTDFLQLGEVRAADIKEVEVWSVWTDVVGCCTARDKGDS